MMLSKRIYLIVFLLCIILFYSWTRKNLLKGGSTLKLENSENVESKNKSETQSQVISQTKISYTEAGFLRLQKCNVINFGGFCPNSISPLLPVARYSQCHFKNLERDYSMISCIHFLEQVT